MSSSHSARKLIPQKLEDDLNNLPKMREVPQKSVAELLQSSAERAMYDELLGPLIPKRSSVSTSKNTLPFDSRLSNPVLPTESKDSNFTSTILTRLSNIEAEAKELRRQLALKTQEIDKLQKENHELELSQDNSRLLREFHLVQEENTQLHQQIFEMTQFLDDYGLVWVGSTPHNNNNNNKKKNNHQNDNPQLHLSDPNTDELDLLENTNLSLEDQELIEKDREACSVDFSRLSIKVKELNEMLASEPAEVKREGESGRIARLVRLIESMETLPLTIYSNGLLVKRGPFRPAGSSSYLSLIQDILEGFFPYEFKDQYPEGFIIQLIDKHTERFREREGEGGGGKQIASLLSSSSSSSSSNSTALSSSQFLNRLPKTVIRNGQLINIREGVRERLVQGVPDTSASSTSSSSSSSSLFGSMGGGRRLREENNEKMKNDSTQSDPSPSPSSLSSPSLPHLASTTSSSSSTSTSLPPSSSSASVLVRWLDGRQFLLKMRGEDTIHDLRERLERQLLAPLPSLPSDPSPPSLLSSHLDRSIPSYELRSTHPPLPLSDLSLSLSLVGLVPNGTVHARRV